MIENRVDLKLTAVFFRSFEHVKQLIEKDIASYGLNNTEFGTLEMLYHKGCQTIQTISSRLLMANSSMTYTLDKLESKGFIKRHKDLQDKRHTRIVLTPEGTTYIEGILPYHARTLKTIYGSLSKEDKELLIHLLKLLGFHAESLNRS